MTERTGSSLPLTFLVVEDGDQYSALCYEYNVATCAATAEDVIADLMAAVDAYVELFAEQGKEPELRPADLELLLEFLDLGPA